MLFASVSLTKKMNVLSLFTHPCVIHFGLFLTNMVSEGFEYSLQVLWTTFMIILWCFCFLFEA